MTKRADAGEKGNSTLAAKTPPAIEALDGNLHLPANSRLLTNAKSGADRKSVFLDRDGVLVEDVHYLTRPDQLRLLPGVADAISKLQSRFLIIVVTNQSAIARGLMTETDLLDIHAVLIGLLETDGAILDALYYCPHLPFAAVDAYHSRCICRKPGPGMLLKAAKDWNIDLSRSFMVGDMPRDSEAALAAGVAPIMVGDSPQESKQPINHAKDLMDASNFILGADAAVRDDGQVVYPKIHIANTEKRG